MSQSRQTEHRVHVYSLTHSLLTSHSASHLELWENTKGTRLLRLTALLPRTRRTEALETFPLHKPKQNALSPLSIHLAVYVFKKAVYMFSDRLHWRQRRLGFARQDDNPDWKEALQDHLPAVRQPLQTSLQIQFPGAQMSCAMSSRRLFNLPALQFFHSGKQGLCYWPPLEFWPSLLSENMYVSIHWESIGVWKNHTTISTKGHFWKSHTEKHRRDPQRIALTPQSTNHRPTPERSRTCRRSSHCSSGSPDKRPTSDL